MATELKLPELGENIDSAEVISVMVAVGDTVEVEQEIIEVETDKAVMPIPCSLAGKVTEVIVNVGDTVSVGQVLIKVEVSDTESTTKSTPVPDTTHAPDKSNEQPPADHPPTTVESAKSAPQATQVPTPRQDRQPAFASPSTRQFAREIGVNIHDVEGSGPGGRVSSDDIKRHARTFGGGSAGGSASPHIPPLPDFSKWGKIERVKMSNIRKKTAAHMAACWTAPHVTLHDSADVTTLETFRNKYKNRVDAAGGKLTVTSLMLKIVAAALRKYPALNCSIDLHRNEIIQKHFINIGVAADTPRGLVVPVVLDVDKQNITQVSVALTELAEKARASRLTLEEMAGGTFTVTNLGGLGIKYFTPVVNYPEVAILGLGRATMEPRMIEGSFEPRPMMPLSLSFDHRIVDGADGARFLRFIVEAIEEPLLIAME